MSIEPVMPSSHLILCRPLLLLPPIPPSIRVFSSESALLIRWSKYWSFSFNISPSNEHPGLISFRMDWLDLQNILVLTDNYWCLLHGRCPDASRGPCVRPPRGSVLPQSWPPKVHSSGFYCQGPNDQLSCVCTNSKAQAWPPFLSLISVQPTFPLPHLAWGTDHQGLKSSDGEMKYQCPLVTCMSSFTYLSGFRSLQPDDKLSMPASPPIPLQSKW